MIEISSAVQQDKIIELLNHYQKDGVQFSFIEKQGINLYFDTNMDDLEKAAKLAKQLIKAQSWGSVLYLRAVSAE